MVKQEEVDVVAGDLGRFAGEQAGGGEGEKETC
jgi:hypothetical protein